MAKKDSYEERRADDEEMVGILMAISVVSRHLAQSYIRDMCKNEKGKEHGKEERDENAHRRTEDHCWFD